MTVGSPGVGDERTVAEVVEGLTRLLRLPTSMPLRPQDERLLADARRFTFGDGRVAWSLGEGPLVLMIHGWAGRGVQFGGLAQKLAEDGFRCVFFDAGGHGDSAPGPVGFDTFIEDAAALLKAVAEPVFAWIGHSAGALAMMAARRLRGVSADRYVCIAAPRYPYVPIEDIRRKTGAPAAVLERIEERLAEQFACTWHDLERSSAFAPEAKPLLLAYDTSDERVRHHDAEQLGALWPGAEILKTAGYGHNRILQAPEVWEAVRSFLRNAARS